MLQKISASKRIPHGHGMIHIDILFPGAAICQDDSGIGTIGRIDHAQLKPGVLVSMHAHKDDEIISYVRSGQLTHKDKIGETVILSETLIMLMNAGSKFYHEELIPEDGAPVEMLQIFFRPEVNNLIPKIQFFNIKNACSLNNWRLLGSNDFDAPLYIRSKSWLYDTRLTNASSISLPIMEEGLTYLLYIFNGKVQIENHSLSKGDSILIQFDHIVTITANEDSDLVLFVTDEDSKYSTTGMYSGNRL